MINVAKMLEIVRGNPGIRTVQLADRLDCGIEHLTDVLEQYVQQGVIVREEVIAPNQRKASAYRIAADADLPPALVAELSKKAQKEIAAEPVKRMTKVDQAVNFIKGQPGQCATSAELHVLLQLRPEDYPSTYLKNGVTEGRLEKDGKFWRLGPVEINGAPITQPAEEPNVVSIPPKTEEKPEVVAMPNEPVETPQAAASEPATRPQPVKIQMIEEPRFTIQIGKFKIAGMRLVSEWNGLKELRDERERSLIVLTEDETVSRLVDAVLGTGKKPHDIVVIKGHPELVKQLEAAIQPERKAA